MSPTHPSLLNRLPISIGKECDFKSASSLIQIPPTRKLSPTHPLVNVHWKMQTQRSTDPGDPAMSPQDATGFPSSDLQTGSCDPLT